MMERSIEYSKKSLFALSLKFTLFTYCLFIMLSSACTKDEGNVEDPLESEELSDRQNPEDQDQGIDEDAAMEAAEEDAQMDGEYESETSDTIIAEAAVSEIPDEVYSETIEEEEVEPEAVPLESQTMESSAESEEIIAAGVSETPMTYAAEPEAAIESAEGRVVRYARSNNSKIYQSASKSSQVVGSLNKGDIVIVSYQGAWAQLDDGSFVDAAKLSSKGVGRGRSDNPWRSKK